MNKKTIILSAVLLSALLVGCSNASAAPENKPSVAVPTLLNTNTARKPIVENDDSTDDNEDAPNLIQQREEEQNYKPTAVLNVSTATLREKYNEKLNEFRAEIQERAAGVASTSAGVKAKIQEMSDAVKSKIEEQKQKAEARKEKLQEQEKVKVGQAIDSLVTNYTRIIDKIEELKAKTQERIQSMESRGVDLSQSKELLTETENKIAEARAKLAESKQSLEDVLDAVNPGEVYKSAREMLDPTKEAIKTAHQALVDTIASIKAEVSLRTETENTPTTTEQNNTANE